MYSKKNPKVSDEKLLESFVMYEEGATVGKCSSFVGLSGGTYRAHLKGWGRIHVYLEHITRYPNGRVKKNASTCHYNKA